MLAVLVLVSTAASALLGALLLDWRYAEEFHESLRGVVWPVGAYQYDPDLGNFALTPGFSGRMLDGTFYVKTHERGFRIPEHASATEWAPGGLLAIGCSFTYGAEVDAEQTFVHRAGEALDLPTYNFGVSSYSYASSILQIEHLERRAVLAELAPRVLLLSGGMWLDKRSSSPYYPTPDLQLAYAWIGAEPDGSVGIQTPSDFVSVRHALGFAASRGYFDAGSRDGELDLRRRLLLLGVIPRVLMAKSGKRVYERTATPEALNAFVIERVSAVAERIGARLVVLSLPMLAELGRRDGGLAAAARACDCAVVVDGFGALEASDALDARLSHPDPRAHRVYGDAIAAALRGH